MMRVALVIWRGVTVVNPFAAPSSPLLNKILQAG